MALVHSNGQKDKGIVAEWTVQIDYKDTMFTNQAPQIAQAYSCCFWWPRASYTLHCTIADLRCPCVRLI